MERRNAVADLGNDEFPELRWLDATDTAAWIRKGEVSAREVTEAAIRRVEAHNRPLNAVVAETFDLALGALDGSSAAPFHGVPFLVKDLGVSLDTAPYSAGNRALRGAGYRSQGDSGLIRRLRAAGFGFLGRTNSSELGTVPTTEPLAWGPTHNPYQLEHSPGGSSGGSAAAVAAGFTPVAHASDGGGSIRVPASACGLVGLKPSRGRISLAPGAGEAWAGCATDGVVSRSVRDTAALLDVLAGAAPGDPYTAPPPERSFSTAIAEPPPRLRIAVAWQEPRPGLTPAPECVEAVSRVAELLREQGHHVEHARPKAWDDTSVHRAFSQIVAAFTFRDVSGLGELLGRELREEEVEPMNWALAQRGREVSAERYLRSLDEIHVLRRSYAEFFAGAEAFDVLLTPTMAVPPPPLGEVTASSDDPFRGFRRCVPMIAYTAPLNLAGLPAISLPLHTNAAGLPIGVQLVAAYAEEALLLRLARELEVAAPWAQRRPDPPAS